MTKNELIFTLYERLNISSDDTNVPQELLSSLIDSTRALLVKQTYGNKSWNIPIEIKQELCLGLEPVSDVDGLTCFGTILRSKDMLPRGINIKGMDGAVLKVKTYDRKELHLNLIPISRLPMVGHNPFTSGLLFACLDLDMRLYFLSGSKKHKYLEAIKVDGVYEYPDKAIELECREKVEFDYLVNGVNTGETTPQPSFSAEQIPNQLPWKVPAPQEPWDVEYPLEAAMQEVLIEMIVKQMIQKEQLPRDEYNDADDDRDRDRR